jgi:hypothetical protein
MISKKFLDKLRHTNVLIIGGGGIGSHLALKLSNFVNAVYVSDFDTVDYSNLGRTYFNYRQVGKGKRFCLKDLYTPLTSFYYKNSLSEKDNCNVDLTQFNNKFELIEKVSVMIDSRNKEKIITEYDLKMTSHSCPNIVAFPDRLDYIYSNSDTEDLTMYYLYKVMPYLFDAHLMNHGRLYSDNLPNIADYISDTRIGRETIKTYSNQNSETIIIECTDYYRNKETYLTRVDQAISQLNELYILMYDKIMSCNLNQDLLNILVEKSKKELNGFLARPSENLIDWKLNYDKSVYSITSNPYACEDPFGDPNPETQEMVMGETLDRLSAGGRGYSATPSYLITPEMLVEHFFFYLSDIYEKHGCLKDINTKQIHMDVNEMTDLAFKK